MRSQLSNTPLPHGQRLALILEYNGTLFKGWQLQRGHGVATLQGELQRALSEIADTTVRVHCAGRTDAGVHATHQVVHFDAPAQRSVRSWVTGTNSRLPAAIAVKAAQPVTEDFHARFSARFRRYRYLIFNDSIRSALIPDNITWVRDDLDVSRMHLEAQSLSGEQDFSAFRAASCQSTTPMRCVEAVSVFQRGPFVVLDIQANAFLHHMVRNIAGTLIAVGRGLQAPGWVEQLLAGRDRRLAADTAPPGGLYLVDVGYAARFGLPELPLGPLFLAGSTG